MDTVLATQLLGIVVLVGVVFFLSVFVLFVRERLTPSGHTLLTINGDDTVEVELGSRLLDALADTGVFLPAACGGRGNCGQCRVRVQSGGGDWLPNEAAHLSRTELATGERLACMVSIREQIEVSVPDSLLHATKRSFRTVSNRHITPFMKELVLEPADGEGFSFSAGQYALIKAPPHDIEFSDLELDAAFLDLWEPAGLLDLRSTTTQAAQRAYSMANDPRDLDRPTFCVRIALPPPDAPPPVPPGVVSSWLWSLKPDDPVTVTGPFGDFGVPQSDREIVLIAGGAGIAPIRSIILDQLSSSTRREISFWYGVRNLRELCYSKEFDALAATHPNFRWYAALSEPRADPEWTGFRGFIHNVVHDNFLEQHSAPEELEYYMCGPPVMSAAVREMLLKLGVDPRSIFFDDFGTTATRPV